MPAPLLSIVEGWTDPLDLTLELQTTTQSSPQPVDLTGLTVHVILKTAGGVYVKDTTAGITVTGSTSGQLEYAPSSSSGDLFLASQSPYRLRFRLTDALSKKLYHPNDEESLIEVNPL